MEEITVEKIKERIKENLKITMTKKEPAIKTNKPIERSKSSIDPDYGKSMKEKFIAFGLRHKPLLKKIPLINTVARKFYHSMVSNSIPQNSTVFTTNKNVKEIIRKIPFFGFLNWWIYMILKAPSKISQLFSEINELKNRDGALFSEINELQNRNKALESKISRLDERISNIRTHIQVGKGLKPTRQIIGSPTGIMNRAIKSLNDIIPEILFLDNLNACFHPTFYKNWDMCLFMRFILNHFDNTAWILDVGCTSNPLLFNLADKGYLNLNGIDLHLPKENIYIHPQIRYIEADLMKTPFEDCQFDCITSLSVIEHGVDQESYFKEMSRILKTGGVLLTSTDYWPEKIQTQDVPRSMTFGLPWNIFSQREIIELISISERHGFKLLTPLEYTTTEPVVHYLGKAYTFIAFGLEKQGM